MIITKSKQDEADLETGHLVDVGDPSAGPSTPAAAPPPPFEEYEREQALVSYRDVPIPDEPPPDFAPYYAEYYETSSKDVVSHDKHLNEDGEALYRFLIAQSAKPPTYRLHCKGQHSESHYRTVQRTNSEGRLVTESERYNETIVDFDFYIDIGHLISEPPIHWSTADNEPSYRGSTVKQIQTAVGVTDAERKRIKDFDQWVKMRRGRGFPPWIGEPTIAWQDASVQPEDSVVLRSSKTLREWADQYCASPKLLKEFVYEKVVYGWEEDKLKEAVRSAIMQTLYQGKVDVQLELTANKIYVRADNDISRMLSNKWIKFLLWITLIYPFIWLFKRFHSSGGGRWEVCGGAYGLKRWESVAEPSPKVDSEVAVSGVPGEAGSSSSSLTSLPPNLIRTPSGLKKVVGIREGEWFKKWETTISAAVLSRYKSPAPLYQPLATAGVANMLDGYAA